MFATYHLSCRNGRMARSTSRYCLHDLQDEVTSGGDRPSSEPCNLLPSEPLSVRNGSFFFSCSESKQVQNPGPVPGESLGSPQVFPALKVLKFICPYFNIVSFLRPSLCVHG